VGCGSGSRLPGFASQITPMFNLLEVGSSRYSWLMEPLSIDELEPALGQCNNSCPGLGVMRISLFKALPMEAKLCLLDAYNDIIVTGVVPQSWHQTKDMPIVQPGRYLLLSGS
jgi:hypothetical protein